MPYKSEKMRLSFDQDRRRKLTENQRQQIRDMYATGMYSLQELADRFPCSKKTVLLIVNPESAAKARQYTADHWKEHQRPKEVRNATQRATRRYKQELYKAGELTADTVSAKQD